MRGKTLNIHSDAFRSIRIPSTGRTILVKAVYTGDHYEIAEAYTRVDKELKEGSIAAQYQDFKEIIDEWYNAELTAHESHIEYQGNYGPSWITATGWISIMKKYRYSSDFAQAKEIVSKWKTAREQRNS